MTSCPVLDLDAPLTDLGDEDDDDGDDQSDGDSDVQGDDEGCYEPIGV
ncbi:MAG TPA: hypothetical protein VMT20_28035 [Terriglobia bacterium]|nr:hypothetical protein [Terriglobia bacterium]